MSDDVIVIGGGHNGLTAAALLAKAGRNVVVLEQRTHLGGLAASHEFAAGYRTSGIFHHSNRLRGWVVSELGLRTHGLRLGPPAPVFTPQVEGRGLLLCRDPERAGEEIQLHCGGGGTTRSAAGASDAEGYRMFRAYIDKVRSLILSVMDAAPPQAGDEGSFWPPTGLVPLLKSAVGVFKLGQKEMMDLLRVGPCSVEDWLSEYFELRLLRATLAMPALSGTWMSPQSPSTAGMLLISEAMSGEEVVGGPARLINALIAVCRAQGVTMETSAAVNSIDVEAGVCRGVTLRDGRTLTAPVVISTIGPYPTFQNLIEPRHLPGALDQEVRHIRARGTMAKVHLALAGALQFRSRPGEVFQRIQVGEDPNDIERAFDDVRARKLPEQPPLDIRVPSVSDPSLAPDGHHVASIAVHCAAHDLKQGWTEEARRSLLDSVVRSLSRYAPDIRDMIVAHEVVTPSDLESHFGLYGGHTHHAEQALDQFWAMRPGPLLCHYSTPIAGLFLGSSGSHPGGELTCGPGALVAKRVVLR